MKRGIVMSIHEQHAVVMTQDGQFLRAPLAGSPQIGQELLFEEEAAPLPRRRLAGRRRFLTYASSAAAFLLLITVCFLYAAIESNPVVAYVTMDINPSIEIGIDNKEKVRELRAMNEAGSRLIADLDYKGQPVENVATLILEKASLAHYLDAPHKDILIASILMNGSKEQNEEFERLLAQSLDNELRAWLTEHDKPAGSVTITTLFLPAELRSEADSIGISSGKLALYLMAKNEGYTLEIDSLKKQSIDNATASIGGIEGIVGAAEEAASKEQLEKLLQQERAENANAASKPSPTATAKPTVKPTAKPADQPATKPAPKPTSKPTSKPTVKPAGKPGGKPTATAKPGRGDWGKWEDWEKQWGSHWDKEQLEKLRKEWEKAAKEWEKSGKDWSNQWEKWLEEQAEAIKDSNRKNGNGSGKDDRWNQDDRDEDDDRDDDDWKQKGRGDQASWNNGAGVGMFSGSSGGKRDEDKRDEKHERREERDRDKRGDDRNERDGK